MSFKSPIAVVFSDYSMQLRSQNISPTYGGQQRLGLLAGAMRTMRSQDRLAGLL